jgi:hypothetical protein
MPSSFSPTLRTTRAGPMAGLTWLAFCMQDTPPRQQE